MTNLFPLPYWVPALKRVPAPLQVLNEAYARPSTSAWRRDLEPWMPSVKQVSEVVSNFLSRPCFERSAKTRQAYGREQ
jgi:hypothetical protein